MAAPISKSVVDRVPIAEAIATTKTRHDDFFPSRVATVAIGKEDGAAGRLRGRLTRGYQPYRAETVQVPKWSGATRPVLDMDIEDRIVFDALTAAIRASLPDGVVNWSPSGEDRASKEEQIAEGNSAYVLRTDVHSYFEYVRHQILADELLDLTGEDEMVEALSSLLGETLGRDTGIPQGPEASRALGDIYLSIVDRALAREGTDFLRFSDDYRIPAMTWRDAVRIQVRLEHLMRQIGLTISGGKTRIPTRETYSKWLRELRIDRTRSRPQFAVSEYDEDGNPVPVTAPATKKAVGAIAEIAANPDYWGENYDQSRQVLEGLVTLTNARSPDALPYINELAWSFPHLTKNLVRYLRTLARTEASEATGDACANLIGSRHYLFDWQLGWLFHALIPGLDALPETASRAALEALHDAGLPWFVRGRAALLLSTAEALPVDQALARLIDEAPDPNKPDFLAALANSPDGRDKKAIIASAASRPLFRSITGQIAADGVGAL